MLLRDRQNEPATQPQGGAPSGPGAGNLDRVREVGQSLFQAADDAIDRALSGDSLAFLQATHQDGGQ